jgi:hypothetical protein
MAARELGNVPLANACRTTGGVDLMPAMNEPVEALPAAAG